MPADLFRPNVVATPSRRRVSVLPVSIALHALAIAAFLIAPLLADVELPPPNQRLALPYIAVLPIAPPVAVRRKSESTRPPSNTLAAAPLVAPDQIPPERDFGTTSSVVPGADMRLIDGVDPGVIAGPPPPPPPPPPVVEPVRVGGRIQAPRKIKSVPPVYPTIAQSSRVQGTVILEALIGLDGRVEQVRVLKPVLLLTDAAVTAVRQWEFTPTTLNGQPVQVVMTVTVDFKLQ
jgi:protein TonB